MQITTPFIAFVASHRLNIHISIKPVLGVSDQVQHKLAVQPQKMARGLKFLIYKLEEMYFLCSKNKGADQLCGYRTADLRLCFLVFSYAKKQVFS